MVRSTITTAFSILFLVALRGVSAQTSLYLPGFDPQPISAENLGVGADGLTTWLIAPGVTSGTLDEMGFFGTATLVEGASVANFVYNDPDLEVSITENCGITDGIAVCTLGGQMAGSPFVGLQTETASPFEVQGGSAAASGGSPAPSPTPAPTAQPGSSGASASLPTSGGSVANGSRASSGQPAPTSSGSASSPPPTDNGAASLRFSTGVALLAAAVVGCLLG